MHTQANKSVSTSTGLKGVSIVRRPSSKISSWKNSVFSHAKIHPENVEVHARKNKKTNITSQMNAVKNKDHVANVNDENTLKANVDVIRALLTTPRTMKSKFVDTTTVVAKTSGCPKHMNSNLKLLRNFVEKVMGTVRFENDHFAAITGYGDYVHGNVTICRVYYIEGLRHNLFSVGDDLLTSARDSNLYTISISDTPASSPQGKSKKAILKPKLVPSANSKLLLIHMDLCGPMRVESINGKKYILTPYGLLKNRKPDVQYFHVFGSLCCPTNDRDDLAKMKPKVDIGIFIGYFESLRGCLEPENNRFNVEDSLDEYNQTPSKEDLNDLFGPLYEEYC
ncbi:hypothetical protein Tco_1171509 [Tanacetum coccineum]